MVNKLVLDVSTSRKKKMCVCVREKETETDRQTELQRLNPGPWIGLPSTLSELCPQPGKHQSLKNYLSKTTWRIKWGSMCKWPWHEIWHTVVFIKTPRMNEEWFSQIEKYLGPQSASIALGPDVLWQGASVYLYSTVHSKVYVISGWTSETLGSGTHLRHCTLSTRPRTFALDKIFPDNRRTATKLSARYRLAGRGATGCLSAVMLSICKLRPARGLLSCLCSDLA